MHVAIDASAALAREPSGVGIYTSRLIAALRRLQRADRNLGLSFLSNCYAIPSGENTSGLVKGDVYPRDRLPTRLVWTQLGVPRSIRRERPDVCHFPNHLAPLMRTTQAPYVVTMHDMSVYRCPEYHTRKTVLVHRAIMPALVRRNCWVVTVSESARRDLVECLRVPEWRTRVVYSGVGEEFLPAAQPHDGEVLAKYGLTRPFVLTVGTLEPRKNHARLVLAFLDAITQHRLPHELVIVGSGGWAGRAPREPSLATSLTADRGARVRLLGYVPSADLPSLYRAATTFAFPSLYEGFGLPVMEALASGTPTLISRDPALVEVTGDAAGVAVDAKSVDDIADGLVRLLVDDDLRAAVRRRGLDRARLFRWDTCARRTLSIYREAGPSEEQRLPAAG